MVANHRPITWIVGMLALLCAGGCSRSHPDQSTATARTAPSAVASSHPEPSAPTASAPVTAPELMNVTHIAVGQNMDCAVRKDGSVWCWQPGAGARRSIMSDAAQVAVVRGFVCAIQTHGQIACSAPYDGEITQVPLYRDGVNIVGGPAGYCVDTEDGVLRCGVDDEQEHKVKPPSGLPGLKHPAAFALGQQLGFGVVDGDIWAWDNVGGAGLPKTLAAVESARSVAVGRERACIHTEPGEVWCYDIASGDKPFDAKPSQLEGWSGVSALAMSFGETVRDQLCALRKEGTVACSDLTGEGAQARFPPPAVVPGATGVVELAVGAADHGCVLTRSSAVACWSRAARRAVPVRLQPGGPAPGAAASAHP